MPDACSKKYYITTPIYYVNGLPHVGSALTTVSCDALARYHRLRGRETWLLTGTDENAPKVVEAAEKAGIPTKPFVDELAVAFEECWRELHVNVDVFMRTTDPRHVRAVQEFVCRLQERGYVYKDTYEGWYSVSDETFYRDSEVKDGIAIETGKPVARVQEENYFFRLSAFEAPLRAHIEANPDFLQPDFRRNEVLGFMSEGLRDMCITRVNKGWGIPVPGDESRVIYVWFDALINYLAATGWPDDPNWETLWPADLHFMGKEIFVRFHATLWPAMLMALDLPLPKQVYAHGWWTIQGAKGGKTGASLPHPTRLTRLLAERSGASFRLAADAQRYLLCREMNYGPDTEFTVENLLRRYNTDLANDLGNLLNRTVNMVVRYFDGVVPQTTAHDHEIAALALQVQEEYARAMAEFRLNAALEAAWKLVARMNKYIDERTPWTLAKAANAGDEESRRALETVLYACLEATRLVSILISPFLPVAADAIRAQLGIAQPVEEARWEDLHWGGLTAGTKVGPPQPVFPRIQELTVDEATLYALGSANPPAADEVKERSQPVSETPVSSTQHPAPGTPVAPAEAAPDEAPITIDDFMKVQLRVAEILAAEPVPNATKLLRLTIQVGEDDTRTILAGIAEFYPPEQLVGRQVVIVANLQPRKMRGIESQGMLLAADVEGRAILLQPDSPVPVGSRVR
jgi:methionyl-tRNA synthetase